MAENKKSPLLEIKNLKKYFEINDGLFKTRQLRAVDDVSLEIMQGETLGLVGESGCGKSTLGRTILHLYKPTAGEILYDGKSIGNKKEMDEFRKKATMVFQDPYSSLNPRMTVADIIAEPLTVQGYYTDEAQKKKRVRQLMEMVGLNTEHATRYAHEFSGGQRQRIGIARALAVNPEFIVCDEPVSALDVSIQAQVINQFDILKKKLGLTYLFISHDLLIVRHISDRIAVMYLGKLVEIGDADTVYDEPLHPYTRSLIQAVPIPDPDHKQQDGPVLGGDIPSVTDIPTGCVFRTRCPFADERCEKEMPQLKDCGSGHRVACFKANK